MKHHPVDLGAGVTELDESSVSIDADFSWILHADPSRITCSIESEDVFRILAGILSSESWTFRNSVRTWELSISANRSSRRTSLIQ